MLSIPLSEETDLNFLSVPTDNQTGLINYRWLENQDGETLKNISAFVFPQVNSLGLLEDVDFLCDFSDSRGIRSIACIDPILLGTGGLKPPTKFGKLGADFIVGEAQHLAIPPNFGGPGLGLFGCRHNEDNKKDLRATPGRYIGKGKDFNGRDCFVMVLSTREQHIRKEKATSNVCSNQAFLATLAGASLLAKGEKGISVSIEKAIEAKTRVVKAVQNLDGITIPFSSSSSFNELLLQTNISISKLENNASIEEIHIGLDVSNRVKSHEDSNILKLTFTDVHDQQDIDKLIDFLRKNFPKALPKDTDFELPTIPSKYLRKGSANLPSFSEDELTQYYEKLADLNVSPDDGCYPLGSCTMKYNPLLNDWAASLPGFANAHPQSPEEDVQGPLEILYEIQEWFKNITGFPE